jgi:hypothetical protein
MKTEEKQRIHLREEFVDTGFIQVFQWRNFQDYFNIELNKAREEERKRILDMINEDRDNGNMISDEINQAVTGKNKCFSPALCLSKIIKYCENTNRIK